MSDSKHMIMGGINGKEMFERLFNIGDIEAAELVEYFEMNDLSKDEISILKNIPNRPRNTKVNLNGLSEQVFYETMTNIESCTDIFDQRDEYYPENGYYCLLKFMFDSKTQLGCIIETESCEIEYFDSRKSIEKSYNEKIKSWEEVGAIS